jgi:hypothetical protein
MRKEAKLGNLFDDQGDDPLLEDDAEWRMREEEAGLPQKVARDWVAFSLAWFEWVFPYVENSMVQFIIMILLYRKRVLTRSRVVSLSNIELRRFGISRFAKYRALTQLERARLLTIQPQEGRRATKVALSNLITRVWQLGNTCAPRPHYSVPP